MTQCGMQWVPRDEEQALGRERGGAMGVVSCPGWGFLVCTPQGFAVI